MRRFLLAFLLAFFLVGGISCDRIRAFLDMPTSSQLTQIREDLRVQAQKRASDSLAAIRHLADSLQQLRDSAEAASSADKKYQIIAAGFKEAENVSIYRKDLEAKGISSIEVAYPNGYTMVSIDGCDSLGVLQKRLEEWKIKAPFLKGLWIYNTKKNNL